jgi:hypothetical protein
MIVQTVSLPGGGRTSIAMGVALGVLLRLFGPIATVDGRLTLLGCWLLVAGPDGFVKGLGRQPC